MHQRKLEYLNIQCIDVKPTSAQIMSWHHQVSSHCFLTLTKQLINIHWDSLGQMLPVSPITTRVLEGMKNTEILKTPIKIRKIWWQTKEWFENTHNNRMPDSFGFIARWHSLPKYLRFYCALIWFDQKQPFGGFVWSICPVLSIGVSPLSRGQWPTGTIMWMKLSRRKWIKLAVSEPQ